MESIRILIDADACPVQRIAEQIAKKREIPVILFSDTNHVLSSDYSEVCIVGAGADAVDFALFTAAEQGISSLRRITAWQQWRLGKAPVPFIRAGDGIRMRT